MINTNGPTIPQFYPLARLRLGDAILSTAEERPSRETNLGRRRKKTLRLIRRSLPKVFACPHCGNITIRITSEEDQESHDRVYHIACGTCGVKRDYRYPAVKADIDVYNTFVDDFARAGA